MPYPSPVNTCDRPWSGVGSTVQNESHSEVGPMNMKRAMALSVNTYFVQLISNIGVCPVTQMATKMGVHRADGKPIEQVPSITLGTQPVTPLTMASAYATFANHGIYCAPVAIESITDANGKALRVPQRSCKQAMAAKTADTLNALLKGVVEDGTGTQAGLKDRDSAGKTGTTDSRSSAWFVGYTSDMAGAVWVGDPAQSRKMYDITIGGRYHTEVFGADTPGPIWRDAMSGTLAGVTSPPLSTVPLSDGKKPGKGRGKGGQPGGPPGNTPPGAVGGTDAGTGTANGGGTGAAGGGGDMGMAGGGDGGIRRPGRRRSGWRERWRKWRKLSVDRRPLHGT